MTAPRRLSHVVSGRQFDRPMLEDIFDWAAGLENVHDHRLDGRIMAALFYEPSTRTRLSFESAMLRLGGGVIGTEAARQFSSAIKGETLEDTVRMVESYADVIVIRHDQPGAAERAAAISRVPVINAGDGPGEHPTQALLDLYTVRAELGRIDGLHIAICGDLRYGRTARSLALLLALFDDVRITFVAPPVSQVGADILAELDGRGVHHSTADTLTGVVETADVVYQTRIQRERFEDPAEYARAQGQIQIDAEVMSMLPERSIVMHPLPRVDEITTDVDGDPRAAYFRQARNGVVIRMALLDMLLS